MGIIWDPEKEHKLLAEREIDLREISELLLAGKYLDILEHPRRPSQQLFVLEYHGYTHVVPFVIDEDDSIVLKTAFPSRKFHQLYGKSHDRKA